MALARAKGAAHHKVGRLLWGAAREGHGMDGEGERRAARTAEDELRERTLFFAEVEHRLKTTLSVLHGWAVTLDERWDALSADARREGVAIVRRSADSLMAECDGVLQEAKAELHSLDLQPEVLDLAELLHAMAVGRRSPLHSIRVDAPGRALVQVDPAALQQVLGHLIENAVKYSPEGGQITLRVRAGSRTVRLDVQDQGIGLPEEGTDRLFEPFQRGGGDSKSRPGAGLGLYIVRKLVESMGGSITARGEPGKGSTFRVRLPKA